MFVVNLTDNIEPHVAERLKKALSALNKMSVRVGLPDSVSVEGENGPLTLAQVGIINEFGTDGGIIPARPFLQRGLEHSKKEIMSMLINDLTAIVRLNVDAIREKGGLVMGRLGAFIAGQIKQGIADGGFEPNAPYTIAKKKSSKPLIDTGLLRQSITWLVKGA
jgi:hypothetical protein